MTALSEGHKVRLVEALARIDDCVVEAAHWLDEVALESPFAEKARDVRPVQREVIVERARRLRDAMRAILARHGVRSPGPAASATEAARMAIHRAVTTAADIEPDSLCAYGALSKELEYDLQRGASQILDLLEEMETHLTPSVEMKPVPCSDREGAAQRELALASELQRVVAAHDLARFRAPLVALTERLEADDLEIAVFGRTNSGKSTLLNRLVEAEVLPVGVTPVTVVPVRLKYGRAAWGHVRFVDAAPQIIAVNRIAEFAAQHFNPSNAAHVIRLDVEIPSPRLRGGLTFVDTPGDAPFDPFPTCDVGIVLIDAMGSLRLEEVAVVDALRRVGSRVIVLLSRSDRLPADDRWRVQGSVSAALSEAAGGEILAYCSCSLATQAGALDEWIELALEPCVAQRVAVRAASLHRKLARLRSAVIEALKDRAVARARLGAAPELWREADSALGEAERAFAAGLRKPLDAVGEAATQADALIEEVALNAAVMWKEAHEAPFDVTLLVAASLKARAQGVTRAVARELARLCAVGEMALAKACAAIGEYDRWASALPRPTSEPLFVDADSVPLTALPKPAWAILGRWRLRRAARRSLRRSDLRTHLCAALARHLARLEEWRGGSLQTMAEGFAAKAAILRAGYEQQRAGHGTSSAASEAAAIEDLERLED